MPKKTKKQKILAEIHRRKITEKLPKYNFVKPPSDEPPKRRDLEADGKDGIKELPAAKLQTATTASESDYLKQDLLKIFLFTIFALISQSVLYYLLQG